ncbi:NAD(P)/FAD-dependent oxidoreductase [Nakamurella endophytica]|uniref:Oxidoreductase n=1 Tax=Nakamurella endophytica TaxID=1748367 RepID=A0A917TB66_9ACTN|nr:FAD-dependent oxidoreductase [Nakamurella endophytica]GGM16322.1 oxidoreductase [Nakamurella endophytica]
MQRVAIVGAGVVGAACAYFATAAGLDVTVLDRRAVAAGTTGAGEGNLLLSDKEAGPELDLALRSSRLWSEIGEDLGGATFELERKGGVVVASTPDGLAALVEFAAEQRTLGVESQPVDATGLRRLEPWISPELPGGVLYPGDMQVQPALAAARLLERARRRGARLELGVEVTGLRTHGGTVTGVETDGGTVAADVVVNAAGTWGGELSARFGAPVPILPRRGFILVTAPLPEGAIRHKVYSADYVANVASDNEGLESSCVVEGTRAGTVLIGASRERVGFDRTVSVPIVRRLAGHAVTLFPALASVDLLRVYGGFRPYCPDHLPAIGFDGRIGGLLHACGHEGAGIGLAPATGELVTQLITGAPTSVDAAAFSPDRLLGVAA